jgi:hypothetical protein
MVDLTHLRHQKSRANRIIFRDNKKKGVRKIQTSKCKIQNFSSKFGLVQLSNNEGNTAAAHPVIARCYRHREEEKDYESRGDTIPNRVPHKIILFLLLSVLICGLVLLCASVTLWQNIIALCFLHFELPQPSSIEGYAIRIRP